MDGQESAKQTKPRSGKQTITKRKRESADRRTLFAAIDFETNALDGDVVFGSLQFELEAMGQRSPIYRVYSAAGMLDLMIEHNAPRMRWFAHNLEYDLLFLLREAEQRVVCGEVKSVKLFERGLNCFYRAEIELPDGEKINFYDSMALFGFSLKVFLKNFSSVGEKLTLDFESETFDIDNPAHIDYALQDTRGLLDAMCNFDKAIYDIFGVHCKGTISSTALAAWEVTLNDDDCFVKPGDAQAEFFREGYFGGLVFLTSTEAKTDYVSGDVNSMYPYVMRKFGVPAGVPIGSKQIKPGIPGMYRAVFTVPDSLPFGCIGYRDNKGICWPRGEFESVAFDFEIERAKRWGCQVKILEGCIFPDGYVFPFEKFVDLCELKRAEYKGQPFEIVVKLIQNSVYGKYGTRTDGREVYMAEEIPDGDGWQPYLDCHQGGLPIQSIYQRETERETYYMLPHWAAHITARARAELLDAYEAAEGQAVYGDTDSIKVPRETFEAMATAGKIRTGKAYGDLKLDAEYQEFRAIAPKVYVYREHDKISGKGKGIPEKHRTAEFWGAVFQGERPTVEYTSLGKLHSTLKKGGERKLSTCTRTSTDLENSIAWWADGTTVKAVTIKNKVRLKSENHHKP